jgi:hypothetical protein
MKRLMDHFSLTTSGDDAAAEEEGEEEEELRERRTYSRKDRERKGNRALMMCGYYSSS